MRKLTLAISLLALGPASCVTSQPVLFLDGDVGTSPEEGKDGGADGGDAAPPLDADSDGDAAPPLDADSDGDAALPADADPDGSPPEDPEVACWLVAPTDEEQIALLEVDMASGSWEEIGRYGAGFFEPVPTPSLAYLDGKLLFQGSDGIEFVVYELDLAAGEIRHGDWNNDAVSVHDGQFLTFCYSPVIGLCHFPDFGALLSYRPSSLIASTVDATNLAAYGDEAYCAGHATDAIEVVSLVDGSLPRSIELEDYDTSVWGMSVAAGNLFLNDGGTSDPWTVHVVGFDLETGERRAEVAIEGAFPEVYSDRPSGLWCESPGPELP